MPTAERFIRGIFVNFLDGGGGGNITTKTVVDGAGNFFLEYALPCICIAGENTAARLTDLL